MTPNEFRTSQHRLKAEEFFNSAAGQEFLLALSTWRPSLGEGPPLEGSGTPIERAALNSKMVQGYELCMRAVTLLHTEPEVKRTLPEPTYSGDPLAAPPTKDEAIELKKKGLK